MNTTVVGIDDSERLGVDERARAGAVAPMTFELIAGGRSNLTYRVVDANGNAFALRRPPTSHVLPTAHDMVREHTVISALYPLGIPVAQPLGALRRRGGQRTALLRHGVRGRRDPARPRRGRKGLRRSHAWCHRRPPRRDPGPTPRRRRRESVSATWRATTATSSVNCGAGGPSTSRCTSKASITAVVEAVGDALNARIPTQQRVSVVHGDYRLDNTVLDDDGRVRAILDWEICTLGDPIADLGLLWSTGPSPRTRQVALVGRRTDDGAGLRDPRPGPQGLRRRTRRSTQSNVAYYQAFGYWKFACIMQGVFARYGAGATAGDQGRSTRSRPISSRSPRARATCWGRCRDAKSTTTSSSSTTRPQRAGPRRRLRRLDRRRARRGDAIATLLEHRSDTTCSPRSTASTSWTSARVDRWRASSTASRPS